MKLFSTISLLILVGFIFWHILIPINALALSCLSFSAERIGIQEDTLVFTGLPTKQIDTKAYNRQLIEVTEVLKGNVAENIWGYYYINKTWGYGCGSGPLELDTEGIFVAFINKQGVYSISTAYETSSEIGKETYAVISGMKLDSKPIEVNKPSKMSWWRALLLRIFSWYL